MLLCSFTHRDLCCLAFRYVPTGETIGFENVCLPQPRSDLLAEKNPSCDVRAYTGGLNACHHLWLLLGSNR